MYNSYVMFMDEYIKEILKLAYKSYEADEVPVGAIIVKKGKIIGRGFNNREYSHLITGHAEINAINDACKFTGDWRLDDCELYVTLKPCMMCTGAIIESRIKKVFYLCDKTNVCENNVFFNEEKIEDSVFYDEYVNLLKLFFENKRI